MLAQVCPIYIHIAAILDGGAIDLAVLHTPFLLPILAAATLASASATADRYKIGSNSPRRTSIGILGSFTRKLSGHLS